MALELFRPFVICKLLEKELAFNIRGAGRLIEEGVPEVWAILEEVIKDKYVMLNRAPTLHRLGIQAFEPVLVEGKAIRLHPLVCVAFNADFDGDQMAVHVPLSIEAQVEARVIMLSTNNILSPANGQPIIVPTQDIVLGIYYLTRDRIGARGEGMRFSSPSEVRVAYDQSAIDLHARIFVRMERTMVETTTGRILFWEIIPEGIPFEMINQVQKKKNLGDLINYSYRFCGAKATVLLADSLRTMGYEYATKAGISIGIHDMRVPSNKQELLEAALQEVRKFESSYRDGVLTDSERYNNVVDKWSRTSDELAKAMMEQIAYDNVTLKDGSQVKSPSFNPLYMMSDSGARGSAQQIRQLAGMRGLMAKPSGEIIENPITANFREGLTVLQYFISTHGARKGLADTALKTANSGYLTRRLVDVAQDAVVAEIDCGTLDGITVSALIESGEVIEPLADRILGRVAAEDIIDSVTSEVIVRANEEINEPEIERIVESGIDQVKIRSVLTCNARKGICALCYGRDLARGSMVNIGETIGVIAAQSIGEPGTQLTMRTFHVGGTATKTAEQRTLEARIGGTIKFSRMKTITNKNGELVVMNRNGEIILADDHDRDKERYSVIYGAKLRVKEGDVVGKKQVLAEWDPFTTPILTEVGGRVKFNDILDPETVKMMIDETTGISTMVVIEPKNKDIRPSISLQDEKGKLLCKPGTKTPVKYQLPVGALIDVKDLQEVGPGDVIAKMPRESAKTKDITGGLPRVAELFEARKPKEIAVITEIDGIVSFGRETKGKRKVVITPEDQIGEPKEYLIPKGKHIAVHEGDRVRAGEPLMDGAANPHDILRVLGLKELAKYLVNEVQEVYRLQGVKIHDKHIETIVRQMMRKVRIMDPGDTTFLVGEQSEKQVFDAENEKIMAAGSRPAIAEPMLLGITKASLSTESFLSAASFQETTKVFTEAAISGKTDHLAGLKENVIMGRLIPAGTGVAHYRNLGIKVVDDTVFTRDGQPYEEEPLPSVIPVPDEELGGYLPTPPDPGEHPLPEEVDEV